MNLPKELIISIFTIKDRLVCKEFNTLLYPLFVKEMSNFLRLAKDNDIIKDIKYPFIVDDLFKCYSNCESRTYKGYGYHIDGVQNNILINLIHKTLDDYIKENLPAKHNYDIKNKHSSFVIYLNEFYIKHSKFTWKHVPCMALQKVNQLSSYDWKILSSRGLTELQIEEHKNNVDWELISRYSKLNIDFIKKYKYRLNPIELISHQEQTSFIYNLYKYQFENIGFSI